MNHKLVFAILAIFMAHCGPVIGFSEKPANLDSLVINDFNKNKTVLVFSLWRQESALPCGDKYTIKELMVTPGININNVYHKLHRPFNIGIWSLAGPAGFVSAFEGLFIITDSSKMYWVQPFYGMGMDCRWGLIKTGYIGEKWKNQLLSILNNTDSICYCRNTIADNFLTASENCSNNSTNKYYVGINKQERQNGIDFLEKILTPKKETDKWNTLFKEYYNALLKGTVYSLRNDKAIYPYKDAKIIVQSKSSNDSKWCPPSDSLGNWSCLFGLDSYSDTFLIHAEGFKDHEVSNTITINITRADSCHIIPKLIIK